MEIYTVKAYHGHEKLTDHLIVVQDGLATVHQLIKHSTVSGASRSRYMQVGGQYPVPFKGSIHVIDVGLAWYVELPKEICIE